MFIGHYAVGFAAKKFAPRASLGALLAAPLLLDFLWPVFLLLGWERVRIAPGNTVFTPLDFVSYPYSHSLLTTIGWATLFGLIYQLTAHYWPGTLMIWLGVVSHWLMDAVVHRPDLPLYPGGSTLVGLGLWNSPAATIAIETALYLVGLWLYVRTTQPVDGIGKYGFWLFVALIFLIYAADAASPPPDVSEKTLALITLVFWLVVPLAWWLDRHRKVRAEGRA